MTQEELLKELGLSHKELQELLAKIGTFLASLDERQQAVVKRSLPPLADAVKTFGPDVSADDLRKLFEGASPLPPVVTCYFAFRRNH